MAVVHADLILNMEDGRIKERAPLKNCWRKWLVCDQSIVVSNWLKAFWKE